MSTTPFTNNLQKDDVVIHADTKRVGKVAFNPTEGSRMTGVIWQGTVSVQYVDVMKLRYVVGGKPEDVPPIEGTPPDVSPPTRAPRLPIQMVANADPLTALRSERDNIDTTMRDMETRFRDLRERKSRIDQAILVLTAPPKPA